MEQLTQSTEIFSCDRLTTYDDLENFKSLDEAKGFFRGYNSYPPTLREALETACISKIETVLGDSMRGATKARTDPTIGQLNLSDDEAGAIACYTLEVQGDISPYKLMNSVSSFSRSSANLNRGSKLLYLFISGLRKLHRFRPSAGQQFYRGIKDKVPQNEQEATKFENGKLTTHQYYEIGKTVTWWSFSSTTTNLEVTKIFIKGAKESTIFIIGGTDLWGYNIQPFSQFQEEEILLEPEAKILVSGVVPGNEISLINVTLHPFEHLVLEDIIPVSGIKINSLQSGQFSVGGQENYLGKKTAKTLKSVLNFSLKNKGSLSLSQGKGFGSTSHLISLDQIALSKKFPECVWKKCPEKIEKYSLDRTNPRIAKNTGGNCTIVGDTPIPPNKVISWSVKILNSKNNDGYGINIGVLPFDTNQNNEDDTKFEWYFDCCESGLWSGPPHNYKGKEYGPRKENGEYVHTGDIIGVVMDTAKGELSFVLNGVNLGVAYAGIPLDILLVPCALLGWEDDSIELDLSEVKENVDASVPIPSNITTNNIKWNSITLTWDSVEGASFYQIEVDGNKSWETTSTNSFTRGEFLAETEHTFKVRAVRGNSVSGWSDITRRRTEKNFSEIRWKEFTGDTNEEIKFSVDCDNPKIARKLNDVWCTIVGNITLPLNSLISWNIKILKSRNDDGNGFSVGVAPFDIDQNGDNICEWYFDCYSSSLCSGPPHNYRWKEYGPRKEEGQYVRNGDVIGVVMNTKNGDLSFVLDGVNYGVAYKGIPLDKPLMPCVILGWEGDSVELDTSEVKENVDNYIPIPSNISIRSDTWDSITITWDEVEGALLYQVEAGNSVQKMISSTEFIASELLPDTEYSFRVRTTWDNTVSEWSDVFKEKTLKRFSDSAWNACPDNVHSWMKYSIDNQNPRIATKTGDQSYCTIIGNTPLPLDTVTSWSVKMLKYESNDKSNAWIGIAPSDIDQNENYVFNKRGWYFGCYNSTIRSGPPHNYKDKPYGKNKEDEQYIHTGDSVGVVMDTIKGELSFVLNGVNYGVAFGGIPLDKPLVPCVLLRNCYDSVELDTSEVKENVDTSVFTPSNVIIKVITWDSITITWDAVEGTSFYQIEVDGSKFWYESITNAFIKRGVLPGTEHTFRVRAVRGNSVSEWSDVVRGRTQKKSFEGSWWKECPDDADEKRKYSVDEKNPKIAKKIGGDEYCTIIGNMPLPLNKVTSWSIKVLKSLKDNGVNIRIGVGPSDIDQNADFNYNKSGWYFYCYNSTLYSGAPHSYRGKAYGPRKGDGEYVSTEDSVGVMMDTAKGELSFALNGVNLGVAYEGIPLDKPLVPCVILGNLKDSVELDISGVKENVVDSSIPVPSNITAKSITWDFITLTWNSAEGASFYQIEVDGSKAWGASTTNAFTKSGLFPDTEHTFRIRAVRGNSMSEWSDVAKGRTQKESFETSGWKECPENVDENKKYSVDENNSRIVKRINGNGYATVIGNTPLPLGTVTPWNIKILNSKNNDGNIYIGVVPSDINISDMWTFEKCGWYFCCFNSGLYSGPPHNKKGKIYGPRKENGEYVHTGDIIGVVMDTTGGNLSFVVNGVNLGVAYEGIPLDKPLVPCVIFGYEDDFIELDPTGVKENVDSSIPVPSNITTKNTTWDSITLAWDAVEGASLYQIEVDGSKAWDRSFSNTFTKRGLLAETEHSFRVRAVRGNSVSEWGCHMKIKTQKESFEGSRWKECPDEVDEEMKYLIENNPRVVTKKCCDNRCTVIGETPLPHNTMASWSIKIMKPRDNNGNGVYIGVAPSDIDQNENENYKECGWYFGCYNSTLWSGPPHKYKGKEYGPRKEENGQYVPTGESVGVVMDTTKGELSFVVNGVNLGVAYEGIPLDKPLVPCVILRWQNCSVELNIFDLKETIVDSSIPVPSNATAKSDVTWDSITLTWDAVEGASFYQVEVNNDEKWDGSITNRFIKKGLLLDNEYTFRVRAVKGNSVSEWSDAATKKITKSFETSWWNKILFDVDSDDDDDDNDKEKDDNEGKEDDDKDKEKDDNEGKEEEDNDKEKDDNEGKEEDDDDKAKTIEDIHSRVGTNTKGNKKRTILFGNTPLPLNKVTSWSIKILGSKVDGASILVGVVETDIDQNKNDIPDAHMRLFVCLDSTLCSIPPHEYDDKEYGPRKGDGKYVHTGDSVGVVMDTAKGELSFVLNGVNLGVAFEGIPLDKPLVPCVFLLHEGDSVELDTSEVKETVADSSIPVPSNISIEGTTWDSITLTWDAVEGASFYQIEVDGSKAWGASTTNAFTKKELPPETEHAFRIRAVKEDKVSEWSDAVKGKTVKKPYSCEWKECPGNVNGDRKYSVDKDNLKVVKSNGDSYEYCTAISNTPLPLNTVTSWSIKVLESRDNDGDNIYVGVAPSDINQNTDNYQKCGWYFGCYCSILRSGPPHNYRGKDYGPRKKKNGQYVNTGDSVGVVMDTAKGTLSFMLGGVNLGVAYEGIPLDKPLVPCIIFKYRGDSVEIDNSEVKENVDSSVPVPPKIISKNGETWDSITLAWDAVEGASFYQIETDGNRSWDESTIKGFTKLGLPPDSVHSFRVRAVKGSSVSEWSDAVRRKTAKESFETSGWKEYSEAIDSDRKYTIDWNNPRIATNTRGSYCTITGSTTVPLDQVTSWKIKILESCENDGEEIWIGIAPFDIDRNVGYNHTKCGWYLGCHESTLCSGPPHNYDNKKYGPKKLIRKGKYVHTGDVVSVVMDTSSSRSELSFYINGKSNDVAYGKIPLDKPLVPCVVLRYRGDSVEIIF